MYTRQANPLPASAFVRWKPDKQILNNLDAIAASRKLSMEFEAQLRTSREKIFKRLNCDEKPRLRNLLPVLNDSLRIGQKHSTNIPPVFLQTHAQIVGRRSIRSKEADCLKCRQRLVGPLFSVESLTIFYEIFYDLRIRQRGGVSHRIQLVFCNFAENATHDFSGTRLW